MFELIFNDIKERFPNKIILSPEDIAPLICINKQVQADMRHRGTFPIPIKKIGKKVGISIYDLAEYLSNDNKKEDVIVIKKEKIKKERIDNIKYNVPKNWHIGFKQQSNYLNELFIEVDKILLNTNIKNVEKEIKRGRF